jgi:hypothetical protein
MMPLRIVKTCDALACLRREGRMPTSYLAFLTESFEQLASALTDQTGDPCFSLKEHGFLVILEPGDNPRHLPGLGLPNGGDLLASWPEYVERIDVGGISIYRIAILYDNEFMMFFFSVVGQLDPKTEAWLADQAS